MGNTNGRSSFLWRRAIKDALIAREKQMGWGASEEEIAEGRRAMQELAEKLLQAAQSGDIAALKEVGDRIDGKAAQQLMLSDPDGGPVKLESRLIING